MAVRASGLGMKPMSSRFVVFTNNSAIPLVCGEHTGVVKGYRPMSSAKARVCRAM